MGFLNPSSFCTAASLWPCRWLRTGLVFIDKAISSSSFDVAPRYLSQCHPVVTLEQTKLQFLYALGQTGFSAGLGALDHFESIELIVCLSWSWAIPVIESLRPKRGRLKFLMDCWSNFLSKEGGKKRGVVYAQWVLMPSHLLGLRKRLLSRLYISNPIWRPTKGGGGEGGSDLAARKWLIGHGIG